MSSPTISHWATVNHILCYLKESPRCGILYKKYGHTKIEYFSNTDWDLRKIGDPPQDIVSFLKEM